MKLKAGILSFAHMHANSYAEVLLANERAQVVGIADSDEKRARATADRFGVKRFASYDELLAESLDCAVVASENVNHRKLVEMCARAGVKAILCEKPLATTAEDARAMIDTCRTSGVQLFTAFPCRFSPAAQRLKEQIEAGVLGTILAVRGTNRGLMPGGWFIEKQLSGGGAVIDHTVHVADANRWLLGKEAVEVHAEIGNGFYHQEWDDSGMLTVTYEGGVFATIDTSWSRPNNFPRGDLTLQVVGTGGVAEADLFTQNVTAYSKESAVSCHGWGSDIDEYMIRDFLRAAGGEKPEYLASGEDGLRALEVALAAYRSAQQGAPVSLTASAVH